MWTRYGYIIALLAGRSLSSPGPGTSPKPGSRVIQVLNHACLRYIPKVHLLLLSNVKE